MTTRIGRFEILAELGTGGMGVVYRARDPHLQREVALKLVRPDRGGDESAKARFLREVRAEAALNHPGIATLYEAGEAPDGRVYFVAELVDGESLSQILARGPVPPAECLRLGIELAEALGAAHRRGIVHRDIKPDNLKITSDGRLKVLDFGLARLLAVAPPEGHEPNATESALTAAYRILGTPAYMSPEQASGGVADARSDVFSVGAVLYEMATGRRAFAAADVSDTLRRVIARDPDSAETINRDVPPALAGVIRKALAKEPADRYTDGSELAAALRAAAARPQRRGRRAWLVAAGVVLLALGTVAGVLWTGAHAPLAFAQRDRLLVGDVENHTEEEVFGLALRSAIESDLAQSPYALVYGRTELADTLRLMRRDPSTPIDLELGRDVCRFAVIKALIVPRIFAAGNAYELQATIVDPETGRTVHTVRASAAGREAVLLDGVDALTSQLRERLGESLASIRDTDLPVVQHTTSSWEALRSLTLADLRWQEAKFDEAERLLRSSLEFDPTFAAAQGSLGLLLIQFGQRQAEGKQLLTAALANAEHATDRERRMARAVHHQFVDVDFEAALREYDTILDLYPDSFPAANNKGRVLLALERYDDAQRAFEHAAELSPASTVPLWNLVWLAWVLDDADAAVAHARELVERLPDNANALRFLGWSYVGGMHLTEAEDALRRCLELDPVDEYALANLGHVLMAAERPGDAVEFYRRDREQQPRALATFWQALALSKAGRAEEAKQLAATELAAQSPESASVRALLEIVAGQPDRARATLDADAASGSDDPMLLAEARALLGDRRAALDAIEQAVRSGDMDWFFLRLRPTLASLHDDPTFVRLASGPRRSERRGQP